MKLHNELQSGSLRLGKSEAPETAMEEEEAPALTEKSSGTFLSGLSDCTNVTFSKVQRFWESNSAAHKEVGGRVKRTWDGEEEPDSGFLFSPSAGSLLPGRLVFLDVASSLPPLA